MAKRHYERPSVFIVEMKQQNMLQPVSNNGDMDVTYEDEDI